MKKKVNNMIVVRREVFSAAHRLYNNNFDHKTNKSIYGKCCDLHGHNFILEVKIKAPVDYETGMVLNFTELKDIVRKYVISKVDHKYLNDDILEFKTMLPTTENMLIVFWQWLEQAFTDKSYKLYKLKLYESENNYVSFSG